MNVTAARKDNRRKFAYSTLAVAGIVAALVIIAATSGLSSSKNYGTSTVATSGQTTTASVDAVNSSYSQHMGNFQSGNLTAVLLQYADNATMTWAGQDFCYGGIYSGHTEITEALQAFFAKTTPGLAIENMTKIFAPLANGQVTVNSTFSFSTTKTNQVGSQTYTGLNGRVASQTTYAYSSTTKSWLISQENWDFSNLSSSTPFCGIPG